MEKENKINQEKERILNYITQKFHREGFYKTSMDEIAIGLRVSKKTLYKYFPSKDELLEIICRRTQDDFSSSINQIAAGEGDVISKMMRIINLYSEFIINISERWMSDLRIHSPHIISNIEMKRTGKAKEILIKLLEQGKKEKLIENFPPEIVVNTFFTSVFSLLHTDFVINSKFSLRDASKHTFDLLFNGLLTDKGKQKYKLTRKETAKRI